MPELLHAVIRTVSAYIHSAQSHAGAQGLMQLMPGKAARTQRDNLKELDLLRQVFGAMLIEAIKPHHVRAYLDKRGEHAKARANREKALLSHVFNKAREWGYTDAPNPCQGVKGYTEKGRDRYVTDAEFAAVHAKADQTVRDAMDVALLTGQRNVHAFAVGRLLTDSEKFWTNTEVSYNPWRSPTFTDHHGTPVEAAPHALFDLRGRVRIWRDDGACDKCR
jgi:integrase